MVATVKLNIDPQVKKELKELPAFQNKDPYIKTLKDHVTNQSAEVQDGRYAILNGVIHCKNHKGYSFWRPMLSSSLENNVIKFVHFSLGHAGSEKMHCRNSTHLLCKEPWQKGEEDFVLL
jgi:hypothetical protein